MLLDMSKSFHVVLAATLLLTACGKKSAPTSVAKETNPPASSGNPLTAPVDYLGAVGAAQKTAVRVVDKASIQRAIDMFNAQEDRYPKDLSELIAKHYLPSLPALPRGMKYLYDAGAGKVEVVREQ
jgi:hypothetical protein